MTMLLELNHVTRFYGIVIGVNDVTLSLPPGAYGLLGPNGAGKSTLLNLITGQLSPSMGHIRVLGRSPRGDGQLMHQIGYLPGSEGMYADVTALEWVMYLTRLHGYSRSEAKDRAKWALERVQLSEHQDRKIASFSRGMRQRTRLAQAIAHQPKFLILDEPFSGLDPIARHAMTTLLKEWIDQGMNLLIASHVLYEIESLTRSFLLLNGGRILASGTAGEIYSLLSELPSEVHIGVDRPRELAIELVACGCVDSIASIETNRMVATTRSLRELGEKLAELATKQRFTIRELRSSDDSLQDVFQSLMRMQRGAR